MIKNSLQTSDASEYRQLIRAEETPFPPTFGNVLSSRAARFVPNQRLKAAFGIHSCFTSEDGKVCSEFRAKVVGLLGVGEIKWVDFAVAAQRIVGMELKINERTVNLCAVVQMITLKTMMTVRWKKDAERTGKDHAIRTLACEVNKQWLRSKVDHKDSEEPPWMFEKQAELRKAAQEVFSEEWDGDFTKDNPFNLILPGYETMWRVVLRCFIEVTARGHDKAVDRKDSLQAFVANPDLSQLQAGKYDIDNLKVPAINISLEALRLYPPTRRIYRQFQDENGNAFQAAADVEALHRNPTHWSPEPKLFNPDRWAINGDHREGVDDPNFMPFGAARLRCPAKQHKGKPMPFGLSMIALLTGALVKATEGNWSIANGNFTNGLLNSSLEAYDGVVLQKIGN